jgi:hypothetical protein
VQAFGHILLVDDRPFGVLFDILRSVLGKWTWGNDYPQEDGRFIGRVFALGLHGRITNNPVLRGLTSNQVFMAMLVVGFVFLTIAPNWLGVLYVREALLLTLYTLGGLLALKVIVPFLERTRVPIWLKWGGGRSFFFYFDAKAEGTPPE